MVRNERLTARIEGDFVVFLIGMRVNRPWKIHKWLPVFAAMPRMLRELSEDPGLGLLGYETWFGRTSVLVQYWRSTEQLMAYAKDRDAQHVPAWKAFNKAVGRSGDVGIWHETYAVPAGSYETVYANMPPFGLGKASDLVPATGNRQSAQERLGKTAAIV